MLKKGMGRNPEFDPNMLLILLLILKAYSEPRFIPMNYKKTVNREGSEMPNIEEKLTTGDVRESNVTSGIEEQQKYLQDAFITDLSPELPKEEEKILKENENIDILQGDNDEEQKNTNIGGEVNKSKKDEISKEDKTNITSDYISVSEKGNSSKKKEDLSDVYDDVVIGLANKDLNVEEVVKEHSISTETIPEYPNQIIKLDSENNKVKVSVPVVLSRFEIEFSVVSKQVLDYPSVDIKEAKKDVFLNECKLLTKANKLFVSGYIRNSVEYSSMKSCEEKLENKVRHITMDIPFKFTTPVTYFRAPELNLSKEQLEIDTLIDEKTGNNLFEKGYSESKYLNEKIYCKLLRSSVEGICSAENTESSMEVCETSFKDLIDRMTVKLTLELLQEQHIDMDK